MGLKKEKCYLWRESSIDRGGENEGRVFTYFVSL